MDDAKYEDLTKAEMDRAWKQFETVRVDALMVNDELRARISRRVQEKIVTGAPRFTSADEPKAEITTHRLIMLLGPFAVEHARVLADELEELGKLQLNDLVACTC